MKKQKVLLAALLVCFSMSLQEAKATNKHFENQDLTNKEYTDYSNSQGGVLNVDKEHSNNVTGSILKKNTASSSGGVIYSSGTVTVEGSTFEENNADGGYNKHGFGGAIYNAGTLTVENSSFTNNNAGKSEYYWLEEGQGGAIYNSKDATITNSTFTGNHARYGGAIYNTENGNLTVQGTFKNNTAQTGGAIYNRQGKVTVESGSTFENNDAIRLDGGAIDNYDGTLNIGDNVTFKDNSAFDTIEGEQDTLTKGGAISSEGDGNSSVSIGNGVTFEGNQAQEGGAIGLFKHNDVTIEDNATFKDNKAARDGGAIYVYSISSDPKPSTFTIGDNAVFEGNQAGIENENGEGYTQSVVFGGAISVCTEEYKSENNSSFTIGDNAVFRNNKAGTVSSSVAGYGGAVYNSLVDVTIGSNAKFEGNEATSYGGAVYNSGNITIKDNALFKNNNTNNGGAVYNQGNLEIGQNAIFKNNNASLYGGAIYNYSSFTIGEKALFEGNSAGSMGGAIFNWTSSENQIQKAVFRNNESAYGGAIYAYSGTLNINDSAFYGNSATNSGGALVTQETTNIDNSVFENNISGDCGGAIYNTPNNTTPNLTVDNSRFTNNKAHYGGALATHGTGTNTDIKNSLFNNNSATLYNNARAAGYSGEGGAIWLDKDSGNTKIESSTFANNTADVNGGAIASYSDVTVTDTSFVNNKAGEKGGAIWANSDVAVTAKDHDIVFLGNSAKDGGDIYMDKTEEKIGSLNLKAGKDRNITFAGGISGAQKYDVTLDGEGKVTLNCEVKNADMKVTAGTLHLAQGSSLGEGTTVNVTGATLDSQDGRINDYSGKVNIGEGSKLKFDLSSANKTTDKFSATEGLHNVTVEDFNFLPDTKVSSGSMTVQDIKDSLGLEDAVDLQLPEKSFKTLTPLRYVNVQSGQNGISYTPSGNSYRDFNPAVMAAPVAAQLGGYLTQLDSYDEAFRNMDMYMIMPKSMRQSMKLKNKYASAEIDGNLNYDNTKTPYDNTALWARPYTTFESVGLKRGPKVSNVAWGSYFGGDTKMFDLKNGWEGMWGAYIGYNGSHQVYNGISIYQNGGTLGLTGTLYKNNFFTGLTANVGANMAEASTNYGDDSFSLLRTGVASKTGYNMEFADGKFIVQPSWLMSYTFVNTEDYTNSAGIRINSSALNALQLEPGIKFIGNFGKGWQPYTGLSIVWNIFDKTDFTASDATLPELSVKPFFKYGIGLRKLYGERFSGYFQTYFTSGGRNGVGLQLGGRWTL